MRKVVSLILVFLIFQSASLYAQTALDILNGISAIVEGITTFEFEQRVSPVSKKELKSKTETALTIQTDVNNTEVYLNNVYQGYSNLTLKNLIPGHYKLELRKATYETEVFYIEVIAGYEAIYSFTMREIRGVIYVPGLTSDSYLYIDNSRFFFEKNEVVMGFHTVEVKRFGYKPYKVRVNVGAYAVETVTPVFEKAPFELSDFETSCNEINPDYYNSSLATVDVSFYVTAEETARLSIYSDEGSLEYSYQFPKFTEWNQSCSWNGQNSEGDKLPDGHYQIELECAGSVYKEDIYINRNLFYPVMNSSPAGLGYGKMPSLEPFRVKYNIFSLNFIPVFTDNRFNCAQFDMAFNRCFSRYIEGGFDFTCRSLPETGFGFNLSGDLKFSNSLPLGTYLDFSYGALVRYGYSQNPCEMPGSDYGAGLGAVLMAGLSTTRFSVTGSFQYLAGCVTGNPAEGESMVSGGISIGAKQSLTNAFFIHASFNNYGVLGFGAGANFMPFTTTIMISASIDGNYYTLKNIVNLNGKVGLSFIF